MKTIQTLKDLTPLISQTYVTAIIVAVIALVIAFAIANLVKWRGGKFDTSFKTRRLWFIIVGIISPIGFYLYNWLYVCSFIEKQSLIAKFTTNYLLATGVEIVVYVILGIVTMLILRKSKWGSILGNK